MVGQPGWDLQSRYGYWQNPNAKLRIGMRWEADGLDSSSLNLATLED
jgi:hypothetical protein